MIRFFKGVNNHLVTRLVYCLALWMLSCATQMAISWPAQAQSTSSTEAAAQSQIYVVLSADSDLYQRSLASLRRELPPAVNLTQIPLEALDPDALVERSVELPTRKDLVVAIGTRATEQVLASGSEARLLSILLPSNTFETLLKRYPLSAKPLQQGRLSAIFMDQPASRQLALARLIKPDLDAVGTLYDIRSEPLVQELIRVAGKRDIEFHSRRLQASDNPIAALREMYREIDVFLAVPGKYIFNRSTAKWMLYLSYRNRKPLLGFSEDYVRAGALAAVYSTPEDIARQAGIWLNDCLVSGHPLPQPSYPAVFSVSVNREVANRMGLGSLIAARLESELRALEQLP